MTQFLRNLLADRRGLSTVEYAFLVILVAAASVGVVRSLGSGVGKQFKASKNHITGNKGIAQSAKFK